MNKNHVHCWNLLMLLVKLELYPFVVYEGKVHPASIHSRQYKEWANANG